VGRICGTASTFSEIGNRFVPGYSTATLEARFSRVIRMNAVILGEPVRLHSTLNRRASRAGTHKRVFHSGWKEVVRWLGVSERRSNGKAFDSCDRRTCLRYFGHFTGFC
jgi:hypothetical protein